MQNKPLCLTDKYSPNCAGSQSLVWTAPANRKVRSNVSSARKLKGQTERYRNTNGLKQVKANLFHHSHLLLCSSALRAAFLLLLLISATWLLGLMAVNSDVLSFHYLFAILSCLQVDMVMCCVTIYLMYLFNYLTVFFLKHSIRGSSNQFNKAWGPFKQCHRTCFIVGRRVDLSFNIFCYFQL